MMKRLHLDNLSIVFTGSSKEDSCNLTPISKNATLPTGCVVNGTKSNIIDVGECQPTPCIRNDSVLSRKTCQDEKFCCSVEEVSDVTISCGSSVTFPISKASRCGCRKCEEPKSKINGVLDGRKKQTEKPIAYSDFTFKGFSYRTDDNGFFSFEVPTGTKRVSVVFRDTYDEEYADLTKVFHVEDGQTLFSKIILKPKPIPQSFNSSEPYKVQLGESENDTGFAEMVIPGDSFLRDDGSVFSGQANLRMDVVDTRNLSDMVTAPADFTTVDEDGEQQMLVSYGMLSLDFEDDRGKKLSPFRPIKLYLDPEKLNISFDSNGNTTTKLWWLDSTTGRWIEASDVRMVTKTSGRGKRSVTHFVLETEIAADISRQGRLNVDWPTPDYAAVRVSAPMRSSIRILCEEPVSTPKRYTGYFEETVWYSEIVCINLWVKRQCYIQGESDNSTFLEPSPVDDFPSSVSAKVVESQLRIFKGGNRKLKSFRFKVMASDDGPVFSWRNGSRGIDTCRNEANLRQFKFNYPDAPNISLASARVTDLKNVSNWYPVPQKDACFIKIVTRGEGPLFLVTSYWPNKRYRYGNSIESAVRVPGKHVFVACIEIRCPGKVYHPNSTKSNKQLPEWTYLHVTHLTGKCTLQKNHLTNQNNVYGDNRGNCSYHSKSHSPRSAGVWLCVPLPDSGFLIHYVYTGSKNDLTTGKNRCLEGNNRLNLPKDQEAQKTEKGPTVEFSCR